METTNRDDCDPMKESLALTLLRHLADTHGWEYTEDEIREAARALARMPPPKKPTTGPGYT